MALVLSLPALAGAQSDGRFSGGRVLVAPLPPSLYTISVKSANFAPLEYTDMQLVAAQEY